ncbi:MAG: SulP family inorganic anion transporter, partial [Phycisphaerae bacterium]|nr:SulP family inorganic anion transporter [Phycisphaerae bacterium]
QILAGYRREWLRADLIAGISVCMVMIPSVVAYAGLAGLPPVNGLYASLAALIGYGLFASSKQVIAGPDAALTLLVGVAITPLIASDPARAPLLAAALAVITGLLLLLTALLRAGVVADLLSKPVLVGYLTGAALILISTQLGKFFGVSLEEREFFPILGELWQRHPEFHGLTTWLGIGLVALQIVLRIVSTKIPSALVVFALALGLSYSVDLEARGVKLVGTVAAGLPAPAVPWIQLSDVGPLMAGAIALALLTIPEGILLARAFASRNGDEIKPNQEIAALGVGNLLSGFLQGFSVGASQSRTTVNESAGGKTPIAGLAAAGGLVLFLLFLTPLLERLPSVVLAAILVYAGSQLIEVNQYRELLRFSRLSFGLALIVMLGVLFAGVLQGILLGVAISLVYVIGRLARPMDAVLREIPGKRRYHDLGDEDGKAAETAPGVIAYRFYAPLVFANAEHFVSRVRSMIGESPNPVRLFVLDAQAISEIDSSALEQLSRLARELKSREIRFRIARANRPLREMLERTGVLTLIGPDALAPSVHSAVHAHLDGQQPRTVPTTDNPSSSSTSNRTSST